MAITWQHYFYTYQDESSLAVLKRRRRQSHNMSIACFSLQRCYRIKSVLLWLDKSLIGWNGQGENEQSSAGGGVVVFRF